MRAQPSANKASIMSFSTGLVRAVSLWRTNTEPSERYLTYTSRSSSFAVWSRTCEKNKLNKTGREGGGRASTQPCFTPLEVLKEFVQSPLQRTPAVMLSWKCRTRVNLHGQPSSPQSFSVDCFGSLGQVYEH